VCSPPLASVAWPFRALASRRKDDIAAAPHRPIRDSLVPSLSLSLSGLHPSIVPDILSGFFKGLHSLPPQQEQEQEQERREDAVPLTDVGAKIRRGRGRAFTASDEAPARTIEAIPEQVEELLP